MFSKINKLTHRYFKSSPFNFSNWINRVNFIIFWRNKICVSSTDVVSFLSPLRCHLSSDWCRHVAVPCHASFLCSQDELAASALSFGNASSSRLPFWVETKHWIRSTDASHSPRTARLPPSTAIKRSSQSWSLSLARAPYHLSSTHCRRSLSPLSHVHRPSAQRHLRWRTSWPSIAFRTTYRHVNSCKNIFWNPGASRGVIN
jgi:hypothetical protein